MKLTKLFFAATATLCLSTLVSCQNGGSQTTSSDPQQNVTASAGVEYNGKIAVVRMDSLMTNYGLYIDKGTEFAAKQEKAQKELERQMRSLESQITDFQEKAQKGQITTYQARTKQEELQKKEQQIIAYRDKVMGELAQEEASISAQISESILNYLKEYNNENKYSMIIQTMGGNPVVLVDPALDITAEVITALNERYEKTLSEPAPATEEKK